MNAAGASSLLLSSGELPQLYSTIDEVENDPAWCRQRQQQPPKRSDPSPSQHRHRRRHQWQDGEPASLSTHLFLHFDVNETILIGDPAGGDSVEECLNKIIAKSAFVSTNKQRQEEGDGSDVAMDDGIIIDESGKESAAPFRRSPISGNVSIGGTRHIEPTHWWNGMPLLSNHANAEDDGYNAENPGTNPPPPLYTGWEWPRDTCPYYRSGYKRHAKEFTTSPSSHGRIYRPLYQEMRSKLGLDHDEDGGGEGVRLEDTFKNIIPAFFHALRHYFPSKTSSSSAGSGSDSNGNIKETTRKNDNPTASIISASNNNNNWLPLPSRVTLVLRTFGTDLPRVARSISEFARGNHPSFPDYCNPDLILEKGNLFCGAWSRRQNGELMYELRSTNDGHERMVHYSGDEEVLEYLQSETIVGVQDCYTFWRDNNYAPWAGKPVWAKSSRNKRNHHHILLDDNIHNDPDDGVGGVRVLRENAKGEDGTVTKTLDKGISSYVSLSGDKALKMHGRHLIRVPTIRPVLEDDWFIKQVEEARWRILMEEEEGIYCKSMNNIATRTLILSNRNLSENDFHRDDMCLPTDLCSVDLSRNRLTCIPSHVCSLSCLMHLDVSRNFLKGLPEGIRQLTSLVTLNALSNHLRLRQLPLDELASLPNLKLLDLRYNRKLKRSALLTLRGALLLDNPELRIDCTVPSQASDCGDPGEKKLSACDRDATLLRSQLEPLSTPQLRKRLERSFGMPPDNNNVHSYDRELVMTTLLRCYERHGPRQVRRERGATVSPRLLATLLAELETLPWPRTTRERPKIRAERYMILQKPGSGKPDSARTRKETAKLMKYKRLFDLAVETLAETDSAFAECFTALAVTYNFVGSPHIDTLNIGPFYGLSLGEFDGGGAIAVECSPFLVAEVDTRGRLAKVDGRFPHWVTPYTGTRYSLIFYVTSGSVEPQTTAIFAPPSPNQHESNSWIPPPAYVP